MPRARDRAIDQVESFKATLGAPAAKKTSLVDLFAPLAVEANAPGSRQSFLNSLSRVRDDEASSKEDAPGFEADQPREKAGVAKETTET